MVLGETIRETSAIPGLHDKLDMQWSMRGVKAAARSQGAAEIVHQFKRLQLTPCSGRRLPTLSSF